MSSALLSYEEAHALVTGYAARLKPAGAVERAELTRAAGRVLAQPIYADQDQPPFARSTRDGFACRSAEISAHVQLPVAGSTHAGQAPPGPLPPNSVWEIMTGAPVPEGADAVVMIEHVEKFEGSIRLLQSRTSRPGDNIVAQGAQARIGEELLPIGTPIGPAEIALAATCGYAELDAFVRPRVAILTTGDELVPVESEPGAGQIRNSNAPMLAALVTAVGATPWVLPAAADTSSALDAALAQAAEADMLLISGGVSAGTFDLVEPALARTNAQFHFTGVRIQPGKPLVFGERPVKVAGAQSLETSRMQPFFGLPGNPVSSAVTFLLFAVPVLSALAGRRQSGPRFALAQLSRETDRHGKPGLTRFLPAHCEFNPPIGQFPQVATVPWQGSGDLPAFARSNCFIVVPEAAGRLEADSIVRILLY